MGYNRVKKPIYISAEEKKRNQAIIDAAKAANVKKNYKAQAIFKKNGSKQDYASIGRFIDEDDAKKFFKCTLESLNSIGENCWKMVGFECLNEQIEVEEELRDE